MRSRDAEIQTVADIDQNTAPSRTTSSTTPRWADVAGSRRAWILTAVAAAVVGGLLSGPAIAQGAGYRFENGMHHVDVAALDVEYRGQLYTWDQIEDLQRQGKATITAMDPGSAQQGKAHAFDTTAEERAWALANGLTGTRP